MSTQASNTGPTPTAQPSIPSHLQNAFDSSIWYLLSLWPALHVAIQNAWNCSSPAEASDKRDWFAGAISDLFTNKPSTDFDDLIVVLLQVMQDEFGVNVEDDSEEEVAQGILVARRRIFEDGDAGAVRELETRWRSRGQLKTDIKVVDGEVEVDENDPDWEGFDDGDGGVDVEMEDAPMSAAQVPSLTPVKEKPPPEVDEDGFTKVVSKKKR